MSAINDMRAISDQTLKVQAFWDDRVEKFTRLNMEVQSHAMDMWKQQVSIQSDTEKMLALRHSRLTLIRETKKVHNKIMDLETETLQIDKDILRMTRLMSPATIYKSRIGKHWTSLSKHLGNSITLFPDSYGEVFKKSAPEETNIRVESKVSGDFVAHCRYNALLVKPGTPTYDSLVEIIKNSSEIAARKITSMAKTVEHETVKLHGILEQHWNRQET